MASALLSINTKFYTVRAKGSRFYLFDGSARFICGWDADPGLAADLCTAATARAA